MLKLLCKFSRGLPPLNLTFFLLRDSSKIEQEHSKQSWLLRWFESKLFDMSYAVIYLFNSKESGVQTYIGNRIFSFSRSDVDFYLQQLVNMYINMPDVAEVLHPYLVTSYYICIFIIISHLNVS